MKIRRCTKKALATAVGFAFTAAMPLSLASHDDDELELDESFVYIELNAFDKDLGFHSKIDGDAWKRMTYENDKGRRILDIRTRGGLRRQGLTELFFESAEPTFDQVSIARFLARFPEGEYEMEGRTIKRKEIEGEHDFSHTMAAPAIPTLTDEDNEPWDCEESEGEVTLTWDHVTTAYSNPVDDRDGLLGGGAALTGNDQVVLYKLVVERADNDEAVPPQPLLVYSFDIVPPLGGGVVSWTVPEEITELEGELKWEIVVRTGSHNQTTYEGCVVEQ